MLETSLRPIADLLRPDVLALLRDSLPLDTAEIEPVARRLAAPSPSRRAGLVVAPQGRGCAAFSVDAARPGTGHLDLIAVGGPDRGRGIGRALVRAAERAMADAGAREVRWAGNPPCYGWPGVDVAYTPALCLAESLGYQRYATASNMTVDLASAPLGTAADEVRLAGQGIGVRRAAADDGAHLLPWAERLWGAGWRAEVATAVDAGHCHIAVRDGSPLAFAAHGVNRPGWFGPMGTDPAARGTGIGAVLLKRCLADQQAAGLRSVEIGWVGPIGFYSRAVGARVGRTFWLYSRALDATVSGG